MRKPSWAVPRPFLVSTKTSSEARPRVPLGLEFCLGAGAGAGGRGRAWLGGQRLGQPRPRPALSPAAGVTLGETRSAVLDPRRSASSLVQRAVQSPLPMLQGPASVLPVLAALSPSSSLWAPAWAQCCSLTRSTLAHLGAPAQHWLFPPPGMPFPGWLLPFLRPLLGGACPDHSACGVPVTPC